MPQSAHARDLARCRRWLRLQGQALSGGDHRRLGGPAAGPSGEVGGDAERMLRLRLPSPRSPDPCRACARCRRPFPGAARRYRRPISAPMSRPSAPAFQVRSTARCWRASIARQRSSSRSTGVFTNTMPTDAYRGAGRPEACYVLERLADKAAHKLGIDRAEIRRRNLVPPPPCLTRRRSGRPTTAATFRRFCRVLLEVADYKGFAKRQSEAKKTRRPRGFGLACYVESSGVAPSRMAAALGARVGFFEAAQVRVAARWQRAGATRHPQSRPGSRHDVCPDHCRRGSACRWRASRSSRATPTGALWHPARSARARSRSAARRSTARR